MTAAVWTIETFIADSPARFTNLGVGIDPKRCQFLATKVSIPPYPVQDFSRSGGSSGTSHQTDAEP
jgi:hypothetical protein